MNDLTKLIVDAHIDDLRREAERAALKAAAARARGERRAFFDRPVTIRRSAPKDEAALTRLAALDSAPPPVSPMLVAESQGELRAALSLTDGTVIADPFHPTADMVELLRTFAGQGRPGDKPRLLLWLKRRMQERDVPGHRTPALA